MTKHPGPMQRDPGYHTAMPNSSHLHTDTPTSAVATGDTPDAAEPHNRQAFLRILWLVGVGFFIQTIATDSGIASLPIKLLLKNHLHRDAQEVSGFLAIANIAWYLKPVAGTVADNVTIGGSRYRNYLLIGALGAALAWVAMGLVPQTYQLLLVTFVVVNVLLMLISTVLGGYMVIEGREYKATGRLGSFRNSAMMAATLVAGPISGYLAGVQFGWTAGINAGLCVMFFAYVFAAVREKPVPRTADTASPWRKLAGEFQPLLRARTFWAAVGMTFLLMVMPGFGTPFLYYQTDQLKLSTQFIGNLGLVSSAMGIVGGAAYLVFCRRIPLRTMLAISIVVSAFSTALYELYRGPTSAIIIEATNGLLSALPAIALFDLAARAAPERSASLSYSLLMAVYNFGIRVSDIAGSVLHDRAHMSIFTLIWISAGTTLLTLIAVPFLPRALVDYPDGEPAPEEPT